jgi:hypothetical protein
VSPHERYAAPGCEFESTRHRTACERPADPFNGHIDEFRIAHVQRSDGWIETTANNMSNPGAFAVAGTEERQDGDGEPRPLAGAGVIVCLMGGGRGSVQIAVMPLHRVAANAVAQDPAGNLKLAKDKSTERIDGIVATIMAIGRAMLAQEEPQPEYSMHFV